MEITREIAAKVLDVVDAGLVRGAGEPIPGQMCVEAAVCYAMGLPHGDDPVCVSRALRALKINLNDSLWSSGQARANGLRRLAVAQLGSRDALDDKEFVRRVVDLVTRKYVPFALRLAAASTADHKHKSAMIEAAERCENEGSHAAVLAACTAANNANSIRAASAAMCVMRTATGYADVPDISYAYAAIAANATLAARCSAFIDRKNSDDILGEFAEDVVKILIEMDAPGCVWLDLTDIDA